MGVVQGRIQDLKLEVAQMDWTIWKAGEKLVYFKYVYHSTYISIMIYFKYNFYYNLMPSYTILY